MITSTAVATWIRAHQLPSVGSSHKRFYDRGYPPNTVDFTPIVRGIQASNPDIVYFASAPTETVGIVRAANEIGLKTKLFSGGMVGLQYAAIKTQLGELLNRIVDYAHGGRLWAEANELAAPYFSSPCPARKRSS
jgi:branched-chain amino acid transport system substrate-binding protein